MRGDVVGKLRHSLDGKAYGKKRLADFGARFVVFLEFIGFSEGLADDFEFNGALVNEF